MEKSQEKVIINVGRQFGSGGYDIAKMLAKMFNCKFYDKELLDLAAKESGFSEKFFEQNDEKRHFFRSMFNYHVPGVPSGAFYNNKFSPEGLFLFQSEAIRKAASGDSSCVFVGRCADYVLRDFPNVFNVFITADRQQRIDAVAKREGCDAATAVKTITLKEDTRASYYNYYTGKRWGNSASYHLCVNSSVLGLEGTAEYIRDFINRKLKDSDRKLPCPEG